MYCTKSFVYNLFQALFCIGANTSWFIQYQSRLQRNVLTIEEQNDGWTSDGRAWLGYSYYFVSGALCLFILNMFLIYLAIRPWKNKPRTVNDKNPEGVIMLY